DAGSGAARLSRHHFLDEPTPMTTRHPVARLRAAFAAGLIACAAIPAMAQTGMQRQQWPVASPDGTRETLSALVWYPTTATSTPVRFGPFSLDVALGAPLPSKPLPLVVISHGTGGSELGHAWLAQALVERGYLVVTLRHPHDNVEDRSLFTRSDYFAERPRQVSRLLDALWADP